MHVSVQNKHDDVRELCKRYGVARLDLFGSAARGRDFDEAASDIDFLVEFEPPDNELARYLDFRDALATLFGRAVDLVDRREIEASRNYIRKRAILTGVEPIYAS